MSDSRVPKISTERFFELMQEQNEKVAAQDVKKVNAVQDVKKVNATTSDSVREQRQEERREKYGQLRARPRRRKKTQQVFQAFKDTKLDPDPKD